MYGNGPQVAGVKKSAVTPGMKHTSRSWKCIESQEAGCTLSHAVKQKASGNGGISEEAQALKKYRRLLREGLASMVERGD